MSASSPSRYFIAGDPLRGLAAISIVAYHAAALALIEKGKWPIGPSPEDWARVWKTELARVLPGAASGVRVFFVLSGYLIARPFVRAYALGEPLPSAGVYLRNRALRLLPALWVTFAVVVVWTGLRGASLGHVVRVLALSEHWGESPFDLGLGQAWTLNVEARFYLAVPLAASPSSSRPLGAGAGVRSTTPSRAGSAPARTRSTSTTSSSSPSSRGGWGGPLGYRRALASELSYRLIEQPALSLKGRFRRAAADPGPRPWRRHAEGKAVAAVPLAVVPEGDTIHYAANRIRPVLVGHEPDEIATPHPRHRLERWPERLAGREVVSVDAHGKHLFLRFADDLVLHSHLRMTGSWGVYPPGRRWRRSPRRAWIVFRARGHEVVEFDGPVLELLTESRTRFDRRLAALGPDICAEEFDEDVFVHRLHHDDPRRGIADALLDQRIVSGIGNLWKVEACWRAEIDPWRPVRSVSDDEAREIVRRVRPLMRESALTGHQNRAKRIYGGGGRPCPRCGTRIRARGQGDEARITFWCPGCQR